MSAKNEKNLSGENVDLTAFALGELSEAEMENLTKELEGSPELRAELEETRAMAEALGAALGAEPEAELSGAQRTAIFNEQLNCASTRQPERSRISFKRVALTVIYTAAALVVAFAGIQYFGELNSEAGQSFEYSIGGGSKASSGGSSVDRLSGLGYTDANSLPAETRNQLQSRGYLGDESAPAKSGLGSFSSADGVALKSNGVSLIDLNGFGGNFRYHTWRDTEVVRSEGTEQNTESYAYIQENQFKTVANEPLSTFSIDVDTASYSNVRRFLMDGQLPPPDAVRIEELVNYFRYDYPSPTGGEPFSVDVEVTSAPWHPEHRLARIGLRGKDIAFERRRPTNLVFLLDVSGSMNSADKLPLVKQSLRLLVDQLEATDHVAIAVYAGAAGMVLPPTSGNSKGEILHAMERLSAGGSTNGGEGIRLAYALARQNLDTEGVNRVILCTDGDFNVGTSSEGELVRLIQEEMRGGVELSVLGFGTGNLNDSTMEQLANRGNGNYAYIDSLREARKVLVEEIGGTLVTIAKDVKIQVEFNPLEVSSYRLIGYENRLLANEDFNDDRVDAGEIGSGHTVTALYELVPVGAQSEGRSVDPLKYSQTQEPSEAAGRGELMTVKLRYKQPGGSESRLIERAVRDAGLGFSEASEDTRFAAAVAEFGMKLRGSKAADSTGLESVLRRAAGALGADRGGYRTEFVGLITRAIPLQVSNE